MLISHFSTNKTLCIVAHDMCIVEERFHCIQIVICLRGSYSNFINGQTFDGISGHIIGRNIPYQLKAYNACVLVYCIDPYSYLGQAISAFLGKRGWIDISEQVQAKPLCKILSENDQTNMPALSQRVLSSLLPLFDGYPISPLDQRIVKILVYIDRNLNRTLTLSEMAELVDLSPERVRHLFAEVVGAPFLQYIHWKRVISVLSSIAGNQLRLGEAAHLYGFADQSHFNKIFIRMFGGTPIFKFRKGPDRVFLLPHSLHNDKIVY